MNDYLELSERLYYENFKGDILAFIEAAYRIFKQATPMWTANLYE